MQYDFVYLDAGVFAEMKYLNRFYNHGRNKRRTSTIVLVSHAQAGSIPAIILAC